MFSYPSEYLNSGCRLLIWLQPTLLTFLRSSELFFLSQRIIRKRIFRSSHGLKAIFRACPKNPFLQGSRILTERPALWIPLLGFLSLRHVSINRDISNGFHTVLGPTPRVSTLSAGNCLCSPTDHFSDQSVHGIHCYRVFDLSLPQPAALSGNAPQLSRRLLLPPFIAFFPMIQKSL
jgi:hypothetical protein